MPALLTHRPLTNTLTNTLLTHLTHLLTRPSHQTRHATLIPRPHRPYTFTQLLTLSDGSTFLHRTTSPSPIYKSTRDTRNTPLWNPSNQKLANVEEDEAGRLRAFRRRFGRGWDSEGKAELTEGGKDEKDGESKDGKTEGERMEEEEENLMDLISGFGRSGSGSGSGEERSVDEMAMANGSLVKPTKTGKKK